MPFTNFVAQLANSEVSPQLRMKAKRLLAGPEAEAAAEPASPEDPTLALNPVFQPAEDQSLSLAGNAPVGSRGSALASALLGNAPPTQEAPAATPTRRRKQFSETEGGKYALEYAEKARKLGKGLGFLAPGITATNQRNLAQALDMARLEMAGEEESERSAQWLMDHEEKKVDAEARRHTWLLEDEDRDASRTLKEQELRTQARRAEIEQKRLEEEARSARESEAYRRKVLAREEQPGIPAGVASALTQGFLTNPDGTTAALGMLRQHGILPGVSGGAPAPEGAARVAPAHGPGVAAGPRPEPPRVISGRVGGPAAGMKTATDPTTGQKVFWNGREWVPLAAGGR